jgi:hypothetical protein
MADDAVRALWRGHKFMLSLILAPLLGASTITVGQPSSDGQVVLNVNGTTVTVKVSKAHDSTKGHPEKFTTAEDKEILIGQALDALGIKFHASGTTLVPTISPDVGNVTKVSDTTNEIMKIATAGFSVPGVPAYASLGFSGPLSPLSADGIESTFFASFGINGTSLASTSLSFSQLSSASTDALLTEMFSDLDSQLPSALQPALSLDLASDSITFSFPTGSGEYFVETASTSPGTTQLMSLQATPEPATFLSIGVALILFGIGTRRFDFGYRAPALEATGPLKTSAGVAVDPRHAT